MAADLVVLAPGVNWTESRSLFRGATETAVNTFVKRYDFHYVAMSYGSYADVTITDDPTSPYVREFIANLNNSDLTFVGISDPLVPNIRYKFYRKANGDTRFLALL